MLRWKRPEGRFIRFYKSANKRFARGLDAGLILLDAGPPAARAPDAVPPALLRMEFNSGTEHRRIRRRIRRFRYYHYRVSGVLA